MTQLSRYGFASSNDKFMELEIKNTNCQAFAFYRLSDLDFRLIKL